MTVCSQESNSVATVELPCPGEIVIFFNGLFLIFWGVIIFAGKMRGASGRCSDWKHLWRTGCHTYLCPKSSVFFSLSYLTQCICLLFLCLQIKCWPEDSSGQRWYNSSEQNAIGPISKKYLLFCLQLFGNRVPVCLAPLAFRPLAVHVQFPGSTA